MAGLAKSRCLAPELPKILIYGHGKSSADRKATAMQALFSPSRCVARIGHANSRERPASRAIRRLLHAGGGLHQPNRRRLERRNRLDTRPSLLIYQRPYRCRVGGQAQARRFRGGADSQADLGLSDKNGLTTCKTEYNPTAGISIKDQLRVQRQTIP